MVYSLLEREVRVREVLQEWWRCFRIGSGSGVENESPEETARHFPCLDQETGWCENSFGSAIMKAKRIEFILPLLVSVLSAAAGAADFAGGTGEPNDPYLIATAEQFLTADFNAPATHFQLCNDIRMERTSRWWWPGSFRGHLDGAGFEIQNAVCPWGCFFGTIESEASISNLVLANVDAVMAIPPDDPGYGGPLGGLAAVNLGTITNCGVTGIVATWRVGRVGGFVGFNNGAIVNCYFDGYVMAPWEDLVEGDELTSTYVGGLVSENGGSISNSLARATVLGNRGVGGLVGLNWGTIRNCYARGPVLGEVGAGGLVSENGGRLQTCYAPVWSRAR